METRNLGRSGPHVSAMALGCNNLAGRLDHAASLRVMHAALISASPSRTADVYPVGNSGTSLTHPAPLGTLPSSLEHSGGTGGSA